MKFLHEELKDGQMKELYFMIHQIVLWQAQPQFIDYIIPIVVSIFSQMTLMNQIIW